MAIGDSVEINDGKVARWYDRSEKDYQILQNSATARLLLPLHQNK
jgi:hypothetical protein